jgi:DNA-binding NtrC family response regulator
VVPLPDSFDVVVGRLPGCTITLDYELVSRHHAKITRRGPEIIIEDLGSRNGTFVNGNRIEAQTVIAAGDEIAIGPMKAIVGTTVNARNKARIASASELDERLAAELDRSMRYRRPLGLAMIHFDGSPEAVEEASLRAAEELRRMDFFAQYAPNEFCAVLPEADFASTLHAGQRLVTEARAVAEELGQLAVFVGIAACPEHGSEPGALLSTTRAALRASRAAGPGIVSGPPQEKTKKRTGPVIRDKAMERVYDLVRKVAHSPITVLILGETGVGKEVVAQSLHDFSPRANKPFVALNCSALPENLLESELFGHERGAFTGAERLKVGYFEAAQGGTIFLDEVGEMGLEVQAKLLRVLETRTVTRVGGTEPISVDVRVVCATNRDLEYEVRRGRFREDLFFRLSGFTLLVPPLRNRTSEILPLAEHFAEHFARELGQSPPALSQDAQYLLQSYGWPGNVRELRNAIERAVVLSTGPELAVDALPDRIREHGTVQPKTSMKRRVAEVERSSVVEALEECGYNQTHAAKRLGISRFALIRLLNKYQIERKPRTK